MQLAVHGLKGREVTGDWSSALHVGACEVPQAVRVCRVVLVGPWVCQHACSSLTTCFGNVVGLCCFFQTTSLALRCAAR
jgi:hypothetical protein